MIPDGPSHLLCQDQPPPRSASSLPARSRPHGARNAVPLLRAYPVCDTHQDSGQLPTGSHVQLQGQVVGQGSAQQQDEGEEDAEVGHGEVCGPRETHV